MFIKIPLNSFQRSIAQEATELKEKATNVEEALTDVNGFLQRLQDLAEEVSRGSENCYCGGSQHKSLKHLSELVLNPSKTSF